MHLLKWFYRFFFFTLFIPKTFAQESKFPVLIDELNLIETQLLKSQELLTKLRDPQKNIQKILEEDPLTSFNKENLEFLSKNLSSRQIAPFSVDGTRIKIQSLDQGINPIVIDIDFHYIYRNRISINEEIFTYEIRESLQYNYNKYFIPELKKFKNKNKTSFEKVILPALEIIFLLQACNTTDQNKIQNSASIAFAGLTVACDCYAFSNPASLTRSTGIAFYRGIKKGIEDKSVKSFCETTFKKLPGIRSFVACNKAWNTMNSGLDDRYKNAH
jgi:hypothetical protein